MLRAALERAVKWEWIPSNPAALAAVPRFVRPDVDPPTPEDVARFLDFASAADPDLGTLIWLAMVTGAREASCAACAGCTYACPSGISSSRQRRPTGR